MSYSFLLLVSDTHHLHLVSMKPPALAFPMDGTQWYVTFYCLFLSLSVFSSAFTHQYVITFNVWVIPALCILHHYFTVYLLRDIKVVFTTWLLGILLLRTCVCVFEYLFLILSTELLDHIVNYVEFVEGWSNCNTNIWIWAGKHWEPSKSFMAFF